MDTFIDPIAKCTEWLDLAQQSELNDPTAAALATATPNGVPSVRMVLTKGVDSHGVRFFTNSRSQKGKDLQQNPVAALCFHWKSLRKQVRFEGNVEQLSRQETEHYFHTRGRRSQIAAAISPQSRPLDSRQILEHAFNRYTGEIGDRPVPLPDEWQGYLLRPRAIELWESGEDRMHDRIRFERSGSTWIAQRLYP